MRKKLTVERAGAAYYIWEGDRLVGVIYSVEDAQQVKMALDFWRRIGTILEALQYTHRDWEWRLRE